MLKRAVTIVVLGLCVFGGYSGYKWYGNRQTPQYATEQFAQALAAGPEESYEWLTADLQKDRQVYWKKYLADFEGKTGSPIPAGGASLEDRFNTYTDNEKPYRSFYVFNLDGQEYWLTIIMIRQEKAWKVDELYGSYRGR